MVLCDSHLHLVQCKDIINVFSSLQKNTEYFCVSSCHEVNEYNRTKQLVLNAPSGVHISLSFGIHPQNPDISGFDFLTDILNKGELKAVGEAGFDFFTDEYASKAELQEECWAFQLELAEKYQKPLIVHCRKGMDKVFKDTKKLCRIPAVLFHSYSGTFMEASSLLKRGVNAYFGIGKPLINGKKSTVQCCISLPLERLMPETDSPYQTLKGEAFTSPLEIMRVYDEILKIRQIPLTELERVVSASYKAIFG